MIVPLSLSSAGWWCADTRLEFVLCHDQVLEFYPELRGTTRLIFSSSSDELKGDHSAVCISREEGFLVNDEPVFGVPETVELLAAEYGWGVEFYWRLEAV